MSVGWNCLGPLPWLKTRLMDARSLPWAPKLAVAIDPAFVGSHMQSYGASVHRWQQVPFYNMLNSRVIWYSSSSAHRGFKASQ